MKDAAPTRILLVDDDPKALDAIEESLRGQGYRVEKHAGARAALDRYYHTPFDVVITALRMRDMDGMEVVRLLKMMDPAVVVLITSEAPETGVIREAMKAGAYDYLSSPSGRDDLVFAIERAVERRRLLETNTNHQKNLEKLVSERTRDLLNSFDAAIFGLAKLVEYRDEETGFHLERLSELSATLARRLADTDKYRNQISEGYINHIRRSAPLHDIGKVGIPDRILLKPGKLTHEEFEIIKFHPLIGAEAIREIQAKLGQKRFFNMGMLVAKCHHERWNGSGYPEGLKGAEIPLSARIVALADVYDALRSERPYKAAMTHEKARGILVEERGKHFDPDIVDAFLRAEGEIEGCMEEWNQRLFRGEDTINVIIRKARQESGGAEQQASDAVAATTGSTPPAPPREASAHSSTKTIKTRKL